MLFNQLWHWVSNLSISMCTNFVSPALIVSSLDNCNQFIFLAISIWTSVKDFSFSFHLLSTILPSALGPIVSFFDVSKSRPNSKSVPFKFGVTITRWFITKLPICSWISTGWSKISTDPPRPFTFNDCDGWNRIFCVDSLLNLLKNSNDITAICAPLSICALATTESLISISVINLQPVCGSSLIKQSSYSSSIQINGGWLCLADSEDFGKNSEAEYSVFPKWLYVSSSPPFSELKKAWEVVKFLAVFANFLTKSGSLLFLSSFNRSWYLCFIMAGLTASISFCCSMIFCHCASLSNGDEKKK